MDKITSAHLSAHDFTLPSAVPLILLVMREGCVCKNHAGRIEECGGRPPLRLLQQQSGGTCVV